MLSRIPLLKTQRHNYDMDEQVRLGNVELTPPDAKKVSKYPRTTVFKHVNMFKMKENKFMRVLIYPQKMNISSLNNISWKTSTWRGNYWRKDKTNELEWVQKKEMNHHHKNMNNRWQFLTKRKNILLENDITLPCMMQENLNEDQIKKLKSTPPKITYQAMMEECGNIIDV